MAQLTVADTGAPTQGVTPAVESAAPSITSPAAPPPQPDGQPSTGGGRAITQSQLDAIIEQKTKQHARALDRTKQAAARAALEAVAERFGVAVDDLDGLADRLSSTKTADDSLRVAERRLAKLEAERQELAARLAAAESASREQRLEAMISRESDQAGCNDSETMALLLQRRGLRLTPDGELVTTIDGNETPAVLADLVRSVLKDKPHLQRAPAAVGGGSRGATVARNGELDLTKREDRLAAYIAWHASQQQR